MNASGTANSYDNNGNLTGANAAGALTTYTWDYDNRLETVLLASGGNPITTFTYDGDGLRRQTVASAATTKLIWDGQDVL